MKPSSEPKTAEIKIVGRIFRYYQSFAKKNWKECYHFLDPKLREERISLDTYTQSLSEFFNWYGPIRIVALAELNVVTDIKNPMDDRDLAFGLLVWKDKNNEAHVLRERWVKSGANWYSRKLGLVAPDQDTVDQASESESPHVQHQ